MTESELIEAIKATKKTFLPFHLCSMCNYACGFILDIPQDRIVYDNGCYCVKHHQKRNSSWDEVYDYYSMQNDEGKKHLLTEWRIK